MKRPRNVSRQALAREFGLLACQLSIWETAGVMPAFGSIPIDIYRNRVRMLLAARRDLTMQELREALSVGGC